MESKVSQVVIAVILYLLLLFGIAYYAEKRLHKTGKSIIRHPLIYALSLAIYCTAWTYYGSVGRAYSHGHEFLAIYLGPTLACILFIPVLNKIIRICKSQRITSVADFISTRYGKDYHLAYIVATFCIIGIIPYIALQIKAISKSLQIITGHPNENITGGIDLAFIISLFVTLFTILFGTRSIDASEKHVGMVAAISFESIVKLIAFLCAGIFIVYFQFDGLSNIFDIFSKTPQKLETFTFGTHTSYASWFCLIIISGLAFIFLPRQFQVAVVENEVEAHTKQASWILPLYLLIINVFVLPIAMAGTLLLGKEVHADTYVLSLPLMSNEFYLSLFIFLGGFSAATSMIIVETIALSTMMSNNIIMPIYYKYKERLYVENQNTFILAVRRLSIVLIILLAYFYDKYVASHLSLVSIGLISFAAVSQFAPAVFLGIYWKKASRKGAITGILIGFVIWFYTLILPTFINVGLISKNFLSIITQDIAWLQPYQFLGLDNLDVLTISVFWSLCFNTFSIVLVSLHSQRNVQEIYQSEYFVNIFQYDLHHNTQNIWKNNAYLADVKNLLGNFIDKAKVNKLIQSYSQRHKIDLDKKIVDSRIISFAENILSGIVGSATARNLISTFAKEKEISSEEAFKILHESENVVELNKELRKKTLEIARTKNSLEKVNHKLQLVDEQKDEFLYTVTHEIRTPITSVKAMAELIQDNPEMPEEQRNKFLNSIIKESDRLAQLITHVLTLEKFESGGYKLNYSSQEITDLINEIWDSMISLAKERKVELIKNIPNSDFIFSCDRELIIQVLINLISNAIKFANPVNGKVIVHVITTFSDYNELTVCIEDNGLGVEDEVHELIFDKFFQAKNQTLKKPEGTGLGLAICKKIVDLHKGKIWMDSKNGYGTKLYFSIPNNIKYEVES